MAEYSLKVVCDNCGGTGTYSETQGGATMEVPCNGCNGTGYELQGIIDGDLSDKLDDIVDKLDDILELLQG